MTEWLFARIGDVDATAAQTASAAAIAAQGAAETAQAAAEAAQAQADADVVLTDADVVLTHADVVLTHADVVSTANDKAAADVSAEAAQQWAINPEDDPVDIASGGDDSTTFSALHWAAKSLFYAQQAASLSENPAMTFSFVSGTTDTDPGSGKFALDNATPASATTLYISTADSFGNDVTAWLDYFDDAANTPNGILTIRDVLTPTAMQVYKVTTVTSATGYRKVGLEFLSGGSGSLSGISSILFVPSGNVTTIPHDVTISGGHSLNVSGGLVVNDITFAGTAAATLWSGADAYDLDAGTGGYVFDADLVTEGALYALGGSIPVSASEPGVYFGKESANTNRAIQIVTDTGGLAYIDFAEPGMDFGVRLLADPDGGTLAITADNGATFTGPVSVPDDAYSAGWDGAVSVPTKNAVYDMVESLLNTTLPAVYQPLDSDLTAIAALSTQSYGRAFLAYADEAAFKAAVNLEANTDFYAPAGTDVALADGGTGVSLTDPGADAIMFWDDSAGLVAWLSPTNGLEVTTTNLQMTSNQRTFAIAYLIDGAGSTITTGNKFGLQVPVACSLVSWAVGLDASGSIVVDIWKDSDANYPPTVADTITASAKPTVSSATHAASSSLTGWTTALAAGDWLFFNVDSVTTAKFASLVLTLVKT